MALTGLTPAVRAFLDERRYAVIATINESGAPQLTAIWYELQGDEVMMNTAAGRLKHRNLQRDPKSSTGWREALLPHTFDTDCIAARVDPANGGHVVFATAENEFGIDLQSVGSFPL